MPQLVTAYVRHQYTCEHTDTAPDGILLAITLLAAILQKACVNCPADEDWS